MDDINNYSVNLALNLTSDADQVLASMDNGLSAIESHIHGVANTFATTISSAAKFITTQITDLSKSVIGISDTATKYNETLDNTLVTSTDINKTSLDLSDMLSAISEHWEDTNDTLTTQNILLKVINNASSGLSKVWENLKGFAGEFATELGVVGVAAIAAGIAVTGIKTAWRLLADEEERFVTINYRLYGSQREIVEQVNQTTEQYGLLRGTALQAYQELAGGLRIPAEELGKYVKETVQFNRVTGIGIVQITAWTRRMKMSGYDLAETTRNLRGYESMMRIAGATTSEMETFMRSQTDLLSERTALWGKNATESIMAQEMAMGALLRSHGADIDAITRLNAVIDTNYVNVARMIDIGYENLSLIGLTRSQWVSLSEAQQLAYGKQVAMEKLASAYDSGATLPDKIANVKVLAAAWGLPEQAAANAAAQIHNAYQQMEASGLHFATTQERVNYAMQMYRAEMARTANYQEAMNTLAAKFNTIVGYMQSLWVGVAIALAPLFMRLLGGIEAIAHAGGLLVDVLLGVAKAAAILYAPFVLLYDVAVELVIGIIDGVRAALGPFLTVIDSIYHAIFNQGPAWQEFAKAIRSVGYVIGVVLTPVLVAATAAAAGLATYFFVGLAPSIITFTTAIFTGAVPALGALATALWAGVTAIAAFAAPIWPIILGVAALGTAVSLFAMYLYKTGAAAAFVTNLWAAFKEGIAPLWGALSELRKSFQPIIVAFKPVIDVVKQLFSVTGDKADSFNWIVPVMSTIGKIIGWVLSFAVTPLTWGISILTGVINVVVSSIQWLTGEAEDAGIMLNSLYGFISALFSPFTALWSVITSVIDVFGASGAGLIEEAGWASTALEMLAFPVKMVTAVIGAMGGVIDSVLSGFSGFVTAVGSVISSIGTAISAPINAIGSASLMVGETIGYVLDKLSAFIVNTPGVSAAFSAMADAANFFLMPLKMVYDMATRIPFINKLFGGAQPETPQPPSVNPVVEVSQVGQNTYAALVDPVSSAVDTLWTMVPALTDVYTAMASAVAAGASAISNNIEIPPIGQKFEVEPVTNVKLLNKGDVGTTQLARERQQSQSTKLLEKISDRLENIKSGDNAELKDILAVLRQYLPNIGDGERVAPDLSNWNG